MTDHAGETPTLLRVVRGEPSPDELAALLIVIVSRANTGDSALPTPRSRWADPHSGVRATTEVGPGAWVASGRLPGARTRAGW